MTLLTQGSRKAHGQAWQTLPEGGARCVLAPVGEANLEQIPQVCEERFEE